MKRFLDWLGVVGVLVALTWVAVPSSLFIVQISLTVKDGEVRLVRETPFGPVRARWWSEITLIDSDGFECNSGTKREAYYQEVPGNTVTYRLEGWANDCIDAGPPFYMTIHRQVMLLGFIPLRPVRTVTEILDSRKQRNEP